MDIRFISSLTAEDENLFAPALLKAVGALLDQLPIAYTIRVETTGAQIFQHTHTTPDNTTAAPAPPPTAGAHPQPITGPATDDSIRHRVDRRYRIGGEWFV